ncbi:ROK family transcriptional regulator [Bauldia litoralis]|uniref:Sugar kinase of the NBD/HSP70 family, may contain an N-terminal HTH domain n=1 Tax=Bauldia litoralis TaxID=665467 RepID=A0A1G6DYD5_9HYPH|nr:ROK family transcriptional regulator [Bauldia litoralis]SDB50163.1 Sugar kinase of the NBD/HSP70 family, may contain an N-terminal HTH domain [Bauldia litoralis]
MLLSATNIVKAKLINLWVVFETIRMHGPIPRTQIAAATGLSKASVSNLVDELEGYDLVVAAKSRDRRVGKPPTPLTINPSGVFTIGFHFDYGRMISVVANLAGDVILREVVGIEQLSPSEVATLISSKVESLVTESKIDRARLLGVGVATPGPFGVEGISPPRLPGWDGLELKRRLADVLDLPVVLANDGQCAVTAEWRFGAARNLTNFVYVFIGNGLGSGVMIHSAAYGGGSGNAGEFGHLIVVPGGHACSCGNRGCLETYMSVDSALRYLASHGVAVESIEAFESDFSPSHPLVSQWLDEGVEPLRLGLHTLETLFDPETIMLGGDAPSWLIDEIMQRLGSLYPSVSGSRSEHPRLMSAGLDHDAVARGAAALPVLANLNPQYRELESELVSHMQRR